MIKKSITKLNIFVGRILQNQLVGFVIRKLYRDKIPFRGFIYNTDSNQVSNLTIASLYFHMYESAELRFIKKYLPENLPVIELGGSIGVVSSFIAKNLKNIHICLEANPQLPKIIESNLIFNGLTKSIIINGALTYSDENIYFIRGDDNLTGKIANKGMDLIKKYSLSSIIDEFKVQYPFVLVSDIEGAEIEFLLNEPKMLINCRLIIIELHETTFNKVNYNVLNIHDIIIKIGFVLLERYGNVFVFQNVNSNEN